MTASLGPWVRVILKFQGMVTSHTSLRWEGGFSHHPSAKNPVWFQRRTECSSPEVFVCFQGWMRFVIYGVGTVYFQAWLIKGLCARTGLENSKLQEGWCLPSPWFWPSNSGRHSAIINDFIMSSVKVDLVKPEAIENPRKKSMNLGLS